MQKGSLGSTQIKAQKKKLEKLLNILLEQRNSTKNSPMQPLLFKSKTKAIPGEAGVYMIYSGKTAYYIGQSRNIQSRISKHAAKIVDQQKNSPQSKGRGVKRNIMAVEGKAALPAYKFLMNKCSVCFIHSSMKKLAFLKEKKENSYPGKKFGLDDIDERKAFESYAASVILRRGSGS